MVGMCVIMVTMQRARAINGGMLFLSTARGVRDILGKRVGELFVYLYLYLCIGGWNV